MADDTIVPLGLRTCSAACLPKVITEKLRDTGTTWSLGTFGAIAEFMHEDGEAIVFDMTVDHVQASTDRGAIRLAFDEDRL